MKVGTAIAVVGMWLAVAGALFATKGSPEPVQVLVGLAGFLCALLGTIVCFGITSDDTRKTASPEGSRPKQGDDPSGL